MCLGEHLREVGLGDFHTRNGMRQVGEFHKTHAWLEQDGLVVDITPDQFLTSTTPSSSDGTASGTSDGLPSGAVA
jgi:hypothetical protein